MTESAAWYRGSNLADRIGAPAEVHVPAFDSELAEQRLEQWRRECALLDDKSFALRLEQQGLDEESFRRILGSPAPQPGEPPSWLRQLREIYSGRARRDGFPPDAEPDLSNRVFLPVVRPLLDHGWTRLNDSLKALDNERLRGRDPVFEPRRFAALWAASLPEQLLWMVTRTLMLELTIRRLEGLRGETPEERFASFLDPLCEAEGALALFEVYPVLARNLVTRLEQWIETGLELAGRLAADAEHLAQTFGDPLGSLERLETGLGDRHHGGRTVASLGFSSGVRVMYKPRPLALDVRFQELLRWLDDRGVGLGFRTLGILDRGSYGWVEFVTAAPCESPEEVKRFYARQGTYLALLYALEATDFHHENLIAAGEYPVLVDCETLFQPVLGREGTIDREDLNPVLSTVLRSGLLPRRSWGEAGTEGHDLSGLGGATSNRTPARELVRVGTDEMAYTDSVSEVPGGTHRPYLDGELVPLWLQTETILVSFETTYRKLMALRQFFLEPGGWLDRFASLEIRVILRPTGLYARLMQGSFHPDFLQDALHRDRLLDKLWLDAEQFDFILDAIPCERSDLWRGDFPRFVARTDSHEVWSSDGTRLSKTLRGSGLDLVRMRFRSLDEDDLRRQKSLARLALASSRPLGVPAPMGDFFGTGAGEGQHDPLAVAAPPGREELLAAAHRVGESLETLAFRDGEWISWFHLKIGAGNLQTLEPVGWDLYGGLLGVALFYAQLAEQTGEERFAELARSCLHTGRDRFERSADGEWNLGGYSGLGGWIYGLCHLGRLWNQPQLFEAAHRAALEVPDLVAEDLGLDLIAGSAGCIAGLLALERCRPSSDVLEAAIACGDHLLARAQIQERGIGWLMPQIAERPLTGFAHGAAGIAWALASLAQRTGQERFLAAARQAIAYERSLFSPERQSWPDLRTDRRDEDGWGFFYAWCHGAPGIGLSRLAMLDLVDDPRLADEVEAAACSTLREGFGNSHCLCHGDLGNLEILAGIARRFEDPELQKAVGGIGRALLRSLDRDGYRCGIASYVEIPGLMAGLAGIGYGLLRLADPQRVPSVLLFEVPGPEVAEGAAGQREVIGLEMPAV